MCVRQTDVDNWTRCRLLHDGLHEANAKSKNTAPVASLSAAYLAFDTQPCQCLEFVTCPAAPFPRPRTSLRPTQWLSTSLCAGPATGLQQGNRPSVAWFQHPLHIMRPICSREGACARLAVCSQIPAFPRPVPLRSQPPIIPRQFYSDPTLNLAVA